MDLADDRTANDLTSRLDRPQYKQVIEADIASPVKGSPAHAQTLDADYRAAGRPPYGQRIATTVFLHSLVQTGQSGADPADLRLAVLQPGDDPSLVDKATQRLVDCCGYFDYDGHRYRFKPEPAPRKIIDDEMSMVGRIKAKTELDERIKKIWKKGTFEPEYFPAEAAALDDDARAPKLAVIHYDAANVTAIEAATPPDLVLKLFEHKGSMEEYRTYKNNVLFLVADQVFATTKQAGYRPTDLARDRAAPFALSEELGGCRGLLVLAVKPLRKTSRMTHVSEHFRGMTAEEAYYWSSNETENRQSRRAQKALRNLVAKK